MKLNKIIIIVIYFISVFFNYCFSQDYNCYTSDKIPLFFYLSKVDDVNKITIINNFESKISLSEESTVALDSEDKIELKDLIKNMDGYIHREVKSIFDRNKKYPLTNRVEEYLEYDMKNKEAFTHTIEYLENNVINNTINNKLYSEEFVPEYMKSDIIKDSYELDLEEIDTDFNGILFNVFNIKNWDRNYIILNKVNLKHTNGNLDLVLVKDGEKNIFYNNENKLTTNVKLVSLSNFDEDNGVVKKNNFDEEIEVIIDFYLDDSSNIVRFIINEDGNHFTFDLNKVKGEWKKELFNILKMNKFYRKI
jgi:hypothetical protein